MATGLVSYKKKVSNASTEIKIRIDRLISDLANHKFMIPISVGNEFDVAWKTLDRLVESETPPEVLSHHLGYFLDMAENILKSMPSKNSEIDKSLNDLRNLIGNVRTNISITRNSDTLAMTAQFEILLDSQRKKITVMEEKIQAVRSELSAIISPLEKMTFDINQEFEAAKQDIGSRRAELASFVGLVTGEAITASYQKSAETEKRSADVLRQFAIFFMLLVFFAVVFAYVESAKTPDLSTSIFRLVLASVLSIPAAYLARESAKHRKQQYEYAQIALDVQAITPYIASLPDELQHKLKEEMAARIFVAKSFAHVTKESYPINIQELIVGLVNAAAQRESKSGESTAKPST